jgi:hypothetical protein
MTEDYLQNTQSLQLFTIKIKTEIFTKVIQNAEQKLVLRVLLSKWKSASTLSKLCRIA